VVSVSSGFKLSPDYNSKLFPASIASMTRNPKCYGKFGCDDTESTDDKVESDCQDMHYVELRFCVRPRVPGWRDWKRDRRQLQER